MRRSAGAVSNKTGWKSRFQPQRSEGNSDVTDSYLQDVLTYMTCSRRSTITGKIRDLTLLSWVILFEMTSRRAFCAPHFGAVFVRFFSPARQ